MRHARAMSSRTGGRYSYPVKAPQLDLSLHDELSMMEENDTLYQNDQFNVVFTSRTDHELENQLEEEGKEGAAEKREMIRRMHEEEKVQEENLSLREELI